MGKQDQRSLITFPGHTALEGMKLKSQLQPELKFPTPARRAPPQPALEWGPGRREREGAEETGKGLQRVSSGLEAASDFLGVHRHLQTSSPPFPGMGGRPKGQRTRSSSSVLKDNSLRLGC